MIPARSKHHTGFTLLETLVAISLLAISITAAMSLVHRGLQSTLHARDQIVAYYLAQEAVEYVRSVRDSNRLAPRNDGPVGSSTYWLRGLDVVNGNQNQPLCVSADGTAHCKFSFFKRQGNNYIYSRTSPTLEKCPSDDTCQSIKSSQNFLDFHAGLGYYGYFSGGGNDVTRTSFIRSIAITSPVGADSNEARVAVTVSWGSAFGRRSVSLIEYIKN